RMTPRRENSMGREDEDREVVYVERADDSTLKPLLVGLLIGAGLALLFAPQSGEETRRGLRRRMRKLRAMTEEKVDELGERLGQFRAGKDEETPGRAAVVGAAEGGRPAGSSAREELERRLAEARARRKRPAVTAPEDEEPLA
ncbi:MAG: YtxH domain-containing protein, partial [Gemmatimonadales bacterium]